MILIELEKVWHKFQINWISKTQVMDEIVDTTRFWTDSVHARISCNKCAQMEIWNK